MTAQFLFLTLPLIEPTNGQVLTWDAGAGEWTPTTPGSGTFLAGGDLSGSDTNQTVIGLQNRPVSSTAPTLNQVLEWNGSEWVPGAGGGGGGFTPGGDLSGNSTNQIVIGIQSVSISSTPPSAGQVLTAISPSAANWETPGSGFTAGGDLSGSNTDQTVIAIQGNPVSSSAPSTNQVFVWTGSSWIPTTLSASQLPSLSGDVSGATNLTTVQAIQGKSISNTAPTTGQVLEWSGSAWTPANLPTSLPPSGAASGDLGNSYPNPSVIAIQGNQVSPQTLSNLEDGYVLTWDNTDGYWKADPAAIGFTAGGDLSGSNTDQIVIGLQGRSVSNSAPSSGNTLSWNGSDWIPSPLNLAGGSGYIINTLPVTNLPSLAGDVTGSINSNTVVNINGTSVPATPSANQVLVATSGTTATWEQISNNQVSVSAAIAGTKISPNFGSQNVVTTGTGTFDGIQDSAFGTAGIVHNDSSGNFTSSLIVNADVSSSAGIAYSKLTLTGDVVNADISSSAAIAVSKLAAGTSAQVLLNNSTPSPTWTTLSGDATISNTGTTTVSSIHGATVPAAGGLTTGNGLYVSGTSALSYSALNLGGGSNYVSGTLPAANLPSATTGALGIIELSGDLGGTATSPSVISIHGATVPAGGSLTTGNVLSVSGAGALSYSSLNLAGGSNYVSGQLPVANLANGTAAQLLITNSGATSPAWVSLSGDATITASGAITVAKINGTSVQAGGGLTTGNAAYVSGTSATTYSALNLAGGTGWVTGILPSANQAAQTMSGDVTGSTSSSTVVAIRGNTISSGTLTKGQFLVASSTSNWAPTTLSGDITESGSTAGLLAVTSITGSSGTIPFNATIIGFSSSSNPVNYGVESLSLSSDANYTLASTELINPILNVTSSVSLTATRSIILPATQGAIYWVYNHTTGGQNLTFIASTGTGVTVPNGLKATIYFNGTNYEPLSLVIGGDLSATTNTAQTVAKINGTSVPATPSANQVLVATSGTAATWEQISDAEISSTAAIEVSKLAAGTDGYVLQTNGSGIPTWTKITGDVTIASNGVATVDALQGNAVANTAPTNNYVLTWNGSSWGPAPGSGVGFITTTTSITTPAVGASLTSIGFSASTISNGEVFFIIDSSGNSATFILSSVSGSTATVTTIALGSGTTIGSGATAVPQPPNTVSNAINIPMALIMHMVAQ
jgi:hypothetical protein